ncbi:MAG: ABC transporter substrate-binding protein [Deltaproteobacteria bacterium]|nr:ABC transporter substrate-binding protein [Deltaproteobacteria bacterium]
MPLCHDPFFKNKKDLLFKKDTGINFSYMAFNLKNEYLKNKKVREAIALSIDRDKIITYKLAGMALPADSLMNPDHWARHRGLKPYTYDIEKAKRLLDETPFKDPDGTGPLPRFGLVYKTSSVRERIEIAELIAEGLKRVGIHVTVKPYEFGTFYQDIRQGDFDIFTLTWVGLSDPDIYYDIFHSSNVPPHGANRGFYVNSTVDDLLEKSRTEINREKSREIYHRIQQIIYDDFVYAPLWYESNYVFMNRALNGYNLRPDASFSGLAGVSIGVVASP